MVALFSPQHSGRQLTSDEAGRLSSEGAESWPLLFEETQDMRAGRDDFPNAITSMNWFPNDGCIYNDSENDIQGQGPWATLVSSGEGCFEKVQSSFALGSQQAMLSGCWLPHIWVYASVKSILVIPYWFLWDLDITICLNFLLLHC